VKAATETDPAYEAVAKLLGERTGLFFPPGRIADAAAGIDRAMSRAGIADVAQYLRLLARDAMPLDDLVGELTIGETYFFRDPAHFELIRQEVLPVIRARHAADHSLRAWSAGCASGEEAYSLAILLEEEGMAGRAHILATDISRSALGRARDGRYGPWSLRNTGENQIERYFQRRADRFQLAERFRQRVTFEYLNLALDTYPSFATGTWGMDLIFCRNVFIYLDRETIRKVARRLLGCLAEGGWLITGPSDPALSDDAPYETVVTDAGVFYRRSARPPHSVVEPAPAQQPSLLAESLSFEPSRAPVPPPALEDAASEVPGAAADDPVDEARAAFARGDYGLAVELSERFRNDPAASALHVRSLANLGDALGARRSVAEALATHPLSPELRFLQAVLLVELGRDAEAARELRRVLYLDRSLAAAHFALGTILERLGDAGAARRAYRAARDLCAARPPEEAVLLSDGEPAGRLARAAEIQLSLLESAPEGGP
jgi:chemotaxis protein methyltransferase CheR